MTMQKIHKISLALIFSLLTAGATAQSVAVSGTVTDAGSGQPVVGATVTVEGLFTGTITDINGQYTISVPGADAALNYSFIGYRNQKVEVNGQTKIDVKLEEDAVSLDEVVVVGYGAQTKETVTGAIATIGNKELVKTPASNMTQALAGKIPGVITSQGQGQPGFDEAKIFIRGRGTFSEDGAEPLTLVDGVERSFAQVNPADVAQISILKDASATAVYGVRGANGVILVTTKRGYEGTPEVAFTANVSLQSPTRKIDYLNSYNSAVLLNEARANDGKSSLYDSYDLDMYRKAVLGQLTGDDFYLYPNVDWYDETLRSTAPAQQYDVTVRGGTRRMRYFTSLGYYDQRGLYKPQSSDEYGQSSNARFQRYTFRANLDFLLTSRFTMSLNFGTRFEERKGPNVTENADYNEVFYQINRTRGWEFPVRWPDGRLGGNAFAQKNVVGQLSEGGFYSKTANVNETNVILEHKLDFITQGLSVKAMGSFDYYTDYDRRFSKTFAVYQLDKQKYEQNPDLNDLSNYVQYGEDGRLTLSDSPQYTNLRTHLEVGLNYNRTFGQKHNVSGLVLYSQDNYRWQADVAFRYQGLVGRATYNYDSRYMAEFNFGYNGSENFSKGKRFGFFPSASAGWIISNEKFMRDVKWLDLLKTRVSYGEVGNDKYKVNGVDVRFLYLSGWKQAGGYTFGDTNAVPGVVEGRLPNVNASWERAQKWNAAIEGSIFKNALGVTLDLFAEKRNSILADYLTYPIYLGVDLAPGNIGKASNKGFELALTHRRTLGEWSYNIGASMSMTKNKIVFRDEPKGMPANLKTEGYAIGQFMGLLVDGYLTAADIANPDLPKSRFVESVQAGDLKYRDVNKDGYIDENDAVAIGRTDLPDQTYSLSLGVDWKGLSLSVLFQGVNGVSRYYDAEIMYAFVNGGKARGLHMDRWDPTQSEAYNLQHAKYPLLHEDAAGNHNQRLNSYFLQDAAFIRLKNVELSYTLPKKISQKIFTQDIRIYVNANNLLTWDRMGKLTDPESTGSNIYPIMRVLNMGVNIKF